MTIWRADLTFLEPRDKHDFATEKTYTIHFPEISQALAEKACVRWAEGHRISWATIHSISNPFETLLCIKLYEFTPQPVKPDGFQDPETFLPVFEWKSDWGMPLSESGLVRQDQGAL